MLENPLGINTKFVCSILVDSDKCGIKKDNNTRGDFRGFSLSLTKESFKVKFRVKQKKFEFKVFCSSDLNETQSRETV